MQILGFRFVFEVHVFVYVDIYTYRIVFHSRRRHHRRQFGIRLSTLQELRPQTECFVRGRYRTPHSPSQIH